MHPVFADYFTNATELKQNIDAVLEQAETATVAILAHNQPTAYLTSCDDI